MKNIRENLKNKIPLELVGSWQKSNKLALACVFIIFDLLFYWVVFTIVFLNRSTLGNFLNIESVGLVWLYTGEVLLAYVWILIALVYKDKATSDNKYLQLGIVLLYIFYITYLFYSVGITSIFTGVTLIITSISGAILFHSNIVWRSFIFHIILIIALSFSSLYSISLPTLHEVNKNALDFSLANYSVFWTVFYYVLSIPKALLGVFLFLYLYGHIRRKLEGAEHSATSDELTGLKNRRFIMNHLFDVTYNKDNTYHAHKLQQDISVVIMDLDNFKVINDTHGHLSGDLVLIEVAKRLTSCMLKPYWKASRYGGEEFLIVLPEVAHNNAMEISEHINELIRSEAITIVDGLTTNVTASMGVATLPHDEVVSMRQYYKETEISLEKNSKYKQSTENQTIVPLSNDEELVIESLINIADEALYDAKRNGRNQVRSAHRYVDEKSASHDKEKNMIIAETILDALDIEIY